MDIVKVAGIGLVAAILAITVKKMRPELGFQISIAAGVVILLMICTSIQPVLNLFKSLSSSAGINDFYINTILKIIGIAYVADLVSELCRDADESAIASKVELAGKVAILVVAAPLFDSVLKLINQMIR